MPRNSPLVAQHEAFVAAENERRAGAVASARPRGDQAGAVAIASNRASVEWLPFGPDELEPGAEPVRIVGGFGMLEAEYAALRRGAALRDANERATLAVRGGDRLGFLQRMLTQDLKSLGGPRAAESFWLNRKGRIDADLLIVETGTELLLDVDVHAAAPTRASLDRFLFAEDAAIEDRTERTARLSLHGPGSAAALDRAGLRAIGALEPGGAWSGDWNGAAVTGARRDQCAAPGFELFVPAEAVEPLWRALASVARPIGWDAFNIARIEGGTPLFRVDFGTDALPHETGVLASRVSFTKGCYLGQEIVARMQSLGAPKQQVVRFRAVGAAAADAEGAGSGAGAAPTTVPVAGSPLARPGETLASPVGAVTSSTASPMLGGAVIGFATVRSAVADPRRRLVVHAQGEPVEIELLGAPAPFLPAASA